MCGCCCGGKDPGEEKGLLTSPMRHRGCTDIVCLIIFTFFCCGMVFVAVFSVTKGDAFRLVYGTDSFGNTCDEDNTGRSVANVRYSGQNLKGRPYVFFMDVKDPDRSMTICVNKCPEKELRTREDIFRFSEQTGSLLCRYDLNTIEYYNHNNTLKGPCPVLPVYASKPLLNRCIPIKYLNFEPWVSNNIIAFLNKADIFQKVLRDLYASWQEMIALCFVAVGFAVLMIILIQVMASVVVWIIVVSVLLSSFAGTAFLWWTYIGFKTSLDQQEETSVPLLEVDIDSEQTFLIFSGLASCLTLMLLLVVAAMWRRIGVMLALFHEASRCVSAMPMLMMQAVWTFILLILFFVYWVIILAYLSTAEKPNVDHLGFVRYTEHELVSYFWWYHIIGLVWVSQFIVACQQFVVSGAVGQWYFSRAGNRPRMPILTSMGWLIAYHQGSVAMGAFILTLVKLPRMFFMYLSKKLKRSENFCAQFCNRCCLCCLWCLEKCLKYLSASAYTVIAISGRNFCTSARKAFGILVSNALRVAALNSIGDFVLFLGKITIMAATGAVGVVWFRSRSDLHFFAIPILLVCVFAYFVGHCFLSVYEMTVDALLLCFCEDCDMNDGSLERPYFASKRLVAFVNESTQSLNKLSRRKETNAETEPAQV
ncbi:choline transporter-like protein 1 isoform X2 [Pomacea canaliculata]|uniref:choline transporter-like protein 1 isoform X2 n=1 Tax=Pomacea canaliculata TaxID=400727 RepID=UPI000D72FA38|nr:choline transporter-like protein 1 isoform X2 [Pomacea canaliculata]XP_025111131.1 choline transporter-like protein 1 isoform X2 [Pomacea canaliculata]